MRTIQAQVNINSDRQLTLQLPKDIETGEYQIVVVMNPRSDNNTNPPQHQLNQLAGKIQAFKDIDAVAWQQKTRGEWDEARLSH
ncbi:MAG: hypothetical protein AAFR63_06570 [Cyanobacteria bacterium J06631_6]